MKKSGELPMDPSGPPTLTEQHALIPAKARRRVLLAAEMRCRACGAEDNRAVVRQFLRWPDPAWTPVVPGAPLGLGYEVRVKVLVIASVWPWSGRDEDLLVLCYLCALVREVTALRAAVQVRRLAQRKLAL